MATFNTQKNGIPETTVGPGVRLAVVALSASGTTFTVTSPFPTVYFASATIVGSTSTNSIYSPTNNNTMNASGGITLGAGNTISYSKTNTVSEDISVLIVGV